MSDEDLERHMKWYKRGYEKQMSEDLENAFNEYMISQKSGIGEMSMDKMIILACTLAKEALKAALYWMVEDGRLPQEQAAALMQMLTMALAWSDKPK